MIKQAFSFLISTSKLGSCIPLFFKTISYHLDDKSMPAFLRTIKFSNCKLTDHFCKYLAENLAYLFYVENIDISLNERITMHGKAYLFIHLFDPKYED